MAEGGKAAVNAATTLISPPVKGDRWWAANGTSNFDQHHRRTLIDFAFKCTAAQRFATDWLQFGADGRLSTGDGDKCTDYYAYGADLLAVAAGTVIEARDGIPEGAPPNNYAETTLQNVFGNSVVLDIGENRYAVYAHIIPGTVAVKIGDTVTAGQVVGKLGNSGNSSAPHLHFHLCNGRDALASEGLPFSFAFYDLLGSMSMDDVDAGKAWTPSASPQVRTAEMPMLNQVVNLY
jgi:murein DD-endopeptidase MepM/ murein hydrolase activator NlpD